MRDLIYESVGICIYCNNDTYELQDAYNSFRIIFKNEDIDYIKLKLEEYINNNCEGHFYIFSNSHPDVWHNSLAKERATRTLEVLKDIDNIVYDYIKKNMIYVDTKLIKELELIKMLVYRKKPTKKVG